MIVIARTGVVKARELCCALIILVTGSSLHAQAAAADPSQLIGTWHGTSLCTDRVAAPACKDETVVYELTNGSSDGEVHWVADKIVDGKRVPMGEFDLRYDYEESCWKAEFKSRRSEIVVWCLSVDGDHLTGTCRLEPGGQTVRRVDATKE